MNTVDPGTSTWSRVLNLVGIVAVGWAIIDQALRGLSPWILGLGLLALALWLVLVIVGNDRGAVSLVLVVGMALIASVATVATNGVLLVPVAAAVLRITSRPA